MLATMHLDGLDGGAKDLFAAFGRGVGAKLAPIAAAQATRLADTLQPGVQKTLAERSREALPMLVKELAPYVAVAAGGVLLLFALGRSSRRR